GSCCQMKCDLRYKKHLCAILVVHHKHKEGTEMQEHYTPKGTFDNR
ncbi:hypothetical protein PCS8203_02290, partial [Streptococcus pneumoniae PCS8203]